MSVSVELIILFFISQKREVVSLLQLTVGVVVSHYVLYLIYSNWVNIKWVHVMCNTYFKQSNKGCEAASVSSPNTVLQGHVSFFN